MTFPALLSTAAAALSLLLSFWLFFANAGAQSLQADLQKRQTEFQSQQQQFQLLQQQLQQQQQLLNTVNTLKDQVGPAVVADLKAMAIQDKDDKIKQLLKKYGVSTEDAPAPADGKATPAPAAAPSAAEAPAAKPAPRATPKP